MNYRAHEDVDELNCPCPLLGKFRSIRVDNRADLNHQPLDQSEQLNKIGLHFFRSRKPSDNLYIIAFNSRLRDECLTISLLPSMGDARARVKAWRIGDNQTRPHAALRQLDAERVRRST